VSTEIIEVTDRDVEILRSWLRMSAAAVRINAGEDDCCGNAIVSFLDECASADTLHEFLAKAVALDELGTALLPDGPQP
jgi:hypothetical protein